MNLYPALKAYMGDWTYYIVKMRMQEVAAEVEFGSQVHNDITLDQAIQRTINESRVKKEIVSFLTGRDDRFFSSLVVAAIGGAPKFYPVSIADDPQFEIVADEPSIEQSFGVLRFSGDQKYYALDGQHRLKAIKTLLKPDSDSDWVEPPPDFGNEEISVLMVIRPAEATEENWLQSYRRLFSSLNRYAKPTDQDTNIIMDEDDVFAIVTRRLIANHSFFKAPGRHLESLRVQTKGSSLREGASYFTTIRQLYSLNETLLASHWRQDKGWGPDLVMDLKRFKRFCPPEEYIDELFDELVLYWDAIIAVIPDLALEPSKAKDHQSDGSDGTVADNVLFWPIGQEVAIKVARALLDRAPDKLTLEQAKEALAPLGKVDWGLHKTPWSGLLLVFATNTGKWSMRNESRKPAMEAAEKVLRWLVGIYPGEEDAVKGDWLGQLIPPVENGDELWEEVRKLRDKVSA